jgi:uncharacterized protein (TIGR03000 family)
VGNIGNPAVIEVPKGSPPEILKQPKQPATPPPSSNRPTPPAQLQDVGTTTSRITVTLPADATLFVDNVKCPITSAVRSFTTPAMNANQLYYYTMRVEVQRGGETISETQRITITPGREVSVDFNNYGAIASVAR